MEEHRRNGGEVISIYGQERVSETVRLAKMNLAVHGLGGDIRQGNTYYEDLHNSSAGGSKFDFVMANPPFNVDRVDKERLQEDPRFPDHEKVRLVDSPLGKIPEGWETSAVEKTFEIRGGGTPSKTISDYWDGGTIDWYILSDLTSHKTLFMEESGSKITDLGLQKSSAQIFPPYSVMMTSRATLGVISINTTVACTNQGFITCIPNDAFPLYTLYHWLKENVNMFISLGTGATFKEITKGVFKNIPVLIPPNHLVVEFEEKANSLGLLILNLQRKISILQCTRDLLLPKLISGEVDVSEIDITEADSSS